MNKIELLAPAGSMESLIAAINNGADAIYLGGNKFSARAYASNFDNETMMKAVDYAHSYNVKVYVTINTVLKQSELKEALKYAGYLYEIGVDAIIIQDLGLVKLIRDVYPEFELHASTQMTIHNAEGALYFNEKGMERIVLSRELTLDEIKYISKDLGIETEIFVHGALCVCYSGQCLMSSMIGGRSGNRGRCAQPCRMQYKLQGETSGEERKAYLLSPKDTCFIEDMNAIIKSGTASLKVEGRMKKPEYVAGVTRTYRKAIDKVLVNTKFDLQKGRQELAQLFNREGFAKAYLYKNVGKDMMSYNYPKNTGVFIGQVINSGEVKLEADVALGDGIRFNDDGFTLSKILKNNNEVKEAFKGDIVKLFPTGGYKKGYRLYKMSDKKLYDELNDDLKPYKKKIDLTLVVEFKVNAPLCIKVKYNNKTYKVYGEVVEAATNKPLTRERVEEALKKSGDIPYKSNNIIFDVFDDGFIRIAAINNLRRELFEKILKEEVSSNRRKRNEEAVKAVILKSNENLAYIYSCITKDQLKALVENKEVKNIALDLSFSRQKNCLNKEDIKNLYENGKNKNIYLKVPSIIKGEFTNIVKLIDEIAPLIKGIITSNAGIIKVYKDKLFIIGDYKLNIFNKEAAEFYAEDIDIPCLSLELNRKEIKELMKETKCKVGINIYGKTELMVSEYCPIGSTFGNKSSKKECNGACMKDNFTLIDRMNEGFRVLGDNNCRSHILNSLATNLIEEAEELKSFNITNFRVDFSDESYDEVNDILKQISSGKKNENKKYTKGHYKRGVE